MSEDSSSKTQHRSSAAAFVSAVVVIGYYVTLWMAMSLPPERPLGEVLASHRHALAVLGTLYRPGRYGPGGEILAAPEPLPGYHANLRWLDGQPPAEMLALAVYPATPSVVWA